MIAKLENDEVLEVDIDKVKEYYDRTKSFVEKVYVMIEGEKE